MFIPDKVKEIAKKLQEAGGEVYLVGGCVRDTLAGKDPADYDLVTGLRPDEIIKCFPGKDLELEGKSFGVIRVYGVEIATFRKDIYSEKAHKKGADKIEYADTIEEDLSRRDFTINAVAVRINKNGDSDNVIDPFGGVRDVGRNKLKFVGDPDERIKEDPIRMLRGFRFALDFYNFEEFSEAIERNRAKFLLIDAERIQMELMKVMVKAQYPGSFFHLLLNYDVLKYVMPALDACANVPGGPYHDEDVFSHCIMSCNSVSKKYPRIRMAALLHDVGKPQTADKDGHFYSHEVVGADLVYKDLKKLRFGTKYINYVCEMVRKHMFFFTEVTKDSTYRRYMSNTFVPVRDLLRLRIADRRGNMRKKGTPYAFKRVVKSIHRIEKEDCALRVTDLGINGHDLMKMGFKQGPIFAEILKYLLDQVIEDPTRNEQYILARIVEEKFSDRRKV